MKRLQENAEDSESSGFEDIFDDIEDEDTIFDPSLLDGCHTDIENNNQEDYKLLSPNGEPIPLSSVMKFSDLEIKDDEKEEIRTKPYLPWMPLDKNDELKVNTSAYDLFREMNIEWPCLSFDFLSASDVNNSTISLSFFAGSQAATVSKNRLYYIKIDGMNVKTKSTNPSYSSDDESSDEEDQSTKQKSLSHSFISIPHQGGVNRLRISRAYGIPPFVASWSDTGKVFIWDSNEIMADIDNPVNSVKYSFIVDDLKKRHKPIYKKTLPLATISEHGLTEGFSLAWSSKGTPGRLLSGDCSGHVLLTQVTESSTVFLSTFDIPSVSIEDLSWSPAEANVFTACDTSGTIRIWDVRQNSDPVAIVKASDKDINVISWNNMSSFLLASGADDGEWATWDLRKISSSNFQAAPVISFRWHNAAISSIEWHPTEPSIITVSGSDDQLTIWDLTMEKEESPEKLEEEVPPQLLFIHQGQQDMKEAHWAPSSSQDTLANGVLASTSATGFHIFKPVNI